MTGIAKLTSADEWLLLAVQTPTSLIGRRLRETVGTGQSRLLRPYSVPTLLGHSFVSASGVRRCRSLLRNTKSATTA